MSANVEELVGLRVDDLLSGPLADVDALDLSDVGLRAVSPVHLRYNRNMGVRASMSAAIVVDGELWGLITGHCLTETLHLSLRARNAVDLVARTTSMVLAILLEADEARRRIGHLEILERLGDELTHRPTDEPDDVLLEAGEPLLRIVGANGAAIVTGRGVRTVGECPPPETVNGLVDVARRRPASTLVESEAVKLGGRLDELRDVAAGVLVVPVPGADDRWLTWFRPEMARTIRWGGDPRSKDVDPEAGPGAPRLGPRASFDEYIEVVRGKSDRWTDLEVEAAHLVARRLGDQYAARTLRDAEVAATLQRTLMLERFPDVPGIDGAAHYVPSQRAPIGGDWYDVFFRPDRNPTVVLGDVAGHGVEAAAAMAQLRHALRAYVIRASSVGIAVTRLNDLLYQAMPKEMATAIVAEVDPVRRRVTMVNAGHYPPVLIDAGGARLVETERGLALGVSDSVSYQSSTVDVPANGALVLYSDGLVEHRSQTIDERLELLVSEAAACAEGSTADEIADRLAERVGGRSDTDDDLTVVVVRFVQPVPVADDRQAPT